MRLRKLNDREFFEYCFEEEIQLPDHIAICGNGRLRPKGDKAVIDIVVNHPYRSREVLTHILSDELGGEWDCREICGCVQGDWNILFFRKELENQAYFKEIEAFYFGLVNEYVDEDGSYYIVPFDEDVADYLLLEDVKIFDDIESFVEDIDREKAEAKENKEEKDEVFEAIKEKTDDILNSPALTDSKDKYMYILGMRFACSRTIQNEATWSKVFNYLTEALQELG